MERKYKFTSKTKEKMRNSDISKLTPEEQSQIVYKYAQSHNINELFEKLEQLNFCSIEIAAQVLKAKGYLDDNDYYYLIKKDAWRK